MTEEKPYFTGFISKAGQQLQINVPLELRHKFPHKTHVKVELLDLPAKVKTSLSEEEDAPSIEASDVAELKEEEEDESGVLSNTITD